MSSPQNFPSALSTPGNYIIPIVIESEGRMERAYDIYSRLLKDRIIFIGTPIDDQVANIVIAQLLFLQMQDPKKDINIYINSPGGSVTAGLAIYDTMQFVTCDVNTYCIGIAASMGAVLLTAGTKGKRYALPNSHIMIHQVSGGAQGTASDVERTVEFMYQPQARLNAHPREAHRQARRAGREGFRPRLLHDRRGSRRLWPGGQGARQQEGLHPGSGIGEAGLSGPAVNRACIAPRHEQ